MTWMDKIPELSIGAVATMSGWIATMFHKRVSSHSRRILELEQSAVTRDDFDELRASLTASIVGAHDRMEGSLQRLHDENRSTLDRIHSRVDDLWKRN